MADETTVTDDGAEVTPEMERELAAMGKGDPDKDGE